jgi:hypothetical protein
MAENPKIINEPNDYIWRYMDFTKFVDLIASSSIYFTRADRLGDDYECTVPRGNQKEFIKSSLERLESTSEHNLQEEIVLGDTNDIEALIDITKQVRQTAFISCWHVNRYESAAMWKLYLSQNEGIAIRSTRERLEKATENYRGPMQPGYNGFIEIKDVTYIDYEEQAISSLSWLDYLAYKRISFQHEKELRAIYWYWPFDDSKLGHKISVDLNTLIDCVFVAPTSAPWFKELVETTIGKWGIRIEVCQSSLVRSPLQ